MRVKSTYAGITVVMLAIFLLASSFTKQNDRELRAKQVNLLVREIGDRLMWQAGDRSSTVLPVTEIKEGTFELRFENTFAFSHDSLVALSNSILPGTEFPSGYTVTVHECLNASIAYGFQLNKNSRDIIACLGRQQPAGCYKIEIVFPDLYKEASQINEVRLAVSGVLVVLGITLLVGRFGKENVVVKNTNDATPVLPSIGKFKFDVKGKRLMLGGEVISLTDKECRILELFNETFGELIPRETLMQKVWLDEGVITGRSLDMFVSKLRKKLSGDPELRITNVHGKGYKLELSGINP